MERVVGWADAEGGRGWRAPRDASRAHPGLTLHPTGVVVFATVETTRPGVDAAGRRGDTARALTASEPRRAPSPGLRHRAVRAAAWLLGR